MSDLVKQLSNIERELKAIKAGFKGTSEMFTGATITEESFTLTSTTSMLITVDFEYRDYPDMFITGTQTLPAPVVLAGYGIRRSLYEWYIEYDPAFGTITWECTLFSNHPPTSFTLVQVS